MSSDFWQGKRVFLTGHTGFKGAWLSIWLKSLGAELTGYALREDEHKSLFAQAQVGQDMHSMVGDVRDMQALQTAMGLAKPEIVIHMAAQALVRPSYADPVSTYATNVLGTVHLLEAVRHTSSVRAVVNVTTDKCYENKEWLWGYRENEPLGGHDPYSSSKACSELVSSSYRNSFFPPEHYAQHGVALATARAGNVIGGGDYATDRLIPDIMAAFGTGRPVTIRFPHAIRPWQHVLEPLCGYLTLAQALFEHGAPYAEAWNFGPKDDDARSVQWVVERLAKNWGAGASWGLDGSSHVHEAHNLKLDISKANYRLSWRPRWSLEVALSKTIEWHQAFLKGSNMNAFTLQQVADYAQTLKD